MPAGELNLSISTLLFLLEVVILERSILNF
jgi:hypothetical protein